MGFKERLIALRKERKISQKKLAEDIGVTETTMQRYEYGERLPVLEKAVALAEYFGVSVEYLVGKEKDPKAMGLTDREKELIKYFRALDNDGQVAVLRNARNEYQVQSNKIQHGRILDTFKIQETNLKEKRG